MPWSTSNQTGTGSLGRREAECPLRQEANVPIDLSAEASTALITLLSGRERARTIVQAGGFFLLNPSFGSKLLTIFAEPSLIFHLEVAEPK